MNEEGFYHTLNNQSLQRTFALADLVAHIGERAIERTEEFIEANPGITLQELKDKALYDAGQLFDGMEESPLECEDCNDLTNFEFDLIAAEYVLAVVHWYTMHVNPLAVKGGQ